MLNLPASPKIAFVPSPNKPDAVAFAEKLRKVYGDYTENAADVIVVIGGDGTMLHALHDAILHKKPVYGMKIGGVGFLTNPLHEDKIVERLKKAHPVTVHPLVVQVTDKNGQTHTRHAINDVYLMRASNQAAKISITVDGKVRMEQLVGDGVLVATPAGSTAYNYSVYGPILPLESQLLALTPICPFRPRNWKGALLPHTAKVELQVVDSEYRPVKAVADHQTVEDAVSVSIHQDQASSVTLLFDPDFPLQERVIREQFQP